jgi:hypothetical protein
MAARHIRRRDLYRQQYSVMSYFTQKNYSGSAYRYVITPQMADMYAVAASGSLRYSPANF